MSYTIRDPLGPAIENYARNKRFRNRILKYWPTKTIDGVKVFDRLITWTKHSGTLQDENRKKLYHLLGMKVKELEVQAYDYKGLDRTYLTVNAVPQHLKLTNSEIQQYLTDNSPRIFPNNKNVFSSDPATPATENHNPDPYQNNPKYADIVNANGDLPDGVLPEPQWDSYGWITDYVVYKPSMLSDSSYQDRVTDAEILNFVKNMDSRYVSINGLKYSSPIFFAALVDKNNVLYEKKYTIIKKELTKKTTIYRNSLRNSSTATSSYITNKAVIRVEYRRIQSASSVEAEPVIAAIQQLLTNINNTYGSNNETFTTLLAKKVSSTNNISTQVKNMHYAIKGYNNVTANYKNHLRYDEAAVMYAKDFAKLFAPLIEFGYDETPATFWEKATSVLITVVTVIVVVVLIIFQQYWAVPLAFSMGSLAQGGLASYWASQGKYAAAAFAGGQAQFLADSAKVSGYVVAIAQEAWLALALMSIGDLLERQHASEEWVITFKIASVVALALSGQADTKDAAKDTLLSLETSVEPIPAETIAPISAETMPQVTDSVANSINTTTVMNALNKFSVTDWLSILNLSVKLYEVSTDPSKGLDDMAKKVAAQEKELETSDGPEAIETTEYQFSDPYDNYIDTNARLQRQPMAMTHGLNAALMNKYYNSGY